MSAGIASVSQLLQQLGHVVWWDEQYVTQRFNGRNELGIDYGLPLNSPVSSISSGRVVYAQQMQSNPGSSVGYIVQVENADGSAFHYQHLRSASVQVGDYIRAGQVVGYSGGCPANGYASGGCRYTDQYTTGPHIEVRYTPKYDGSAGAWNQNWINPQGAFQAYGESQTSNMLPSWLTGITGNVQGAVSGATNAATDNIASAAANKLAGSLGQGISQGLRSAFAGALHPAVDFSVRAFLITAGTAVAAVGLFAILLEGGREGVVHEENKVVRSPVGQAVVGEASGQVAKAVVPPVGDQRRARLMGAVRGPQKALPAPADLPMLPPASVKAERQQTYKGIDQTLADLRPGSPAWEQRRAAIKAKANQPPKADVDAQVRESGGTPEVAKPTSPNIFGFPHQVDKSTGRRDEEALARAMKNLRAKKARQARKQP